VQVHVYGCTQNFMFLVPRIQQHPLSAAVVSSYKTTILKNPGNSYPFLLVSQGPPTSRFLTQESKKAQALYGRNCAIVVSCFEGILMVVIYAPSYCATDKHIRFLALTEVS
jgi:hypothetical protein